MLHNYNILKVARVFFDEPSKEHYLKEISQKSGLAHTSVTACLKKLCNEKIIKKENKIFGKRVFPVYRAEMESEDYIFYKKIDNLLRLKETKAVEKIWEILQPRVIVLFGSYCLGEDLEESDIDIFAETEVPQESAERLRKIRGLNRKINIYAKRSFNEVPLRLKRNIVNGIVLRGYIRHDEEENKR